MDGYTGEKRFEDGKPCLYVNGKKTLPMIYALTDIPAFDAWTAEAQCNMRHFAEQGIHLIQAHIFLYKGWHKATGLDIDHAVGELRGVLEADEKAAIMLRLHVGAPYWWLRDHPNDICVFRSGEGDYIDNGEYERLVAGDEERFMRASIASEKWKQDTESVLAEFCRRLSETEEGKHIFAIQIAGGVYAEWHQWGFTYQPDYSEAMTAYFRWWLKKKYQSVEALRQAWKQTDVQFHTAELAPPETRHLNPDGSYGVPPDGVCYRVPREDVWALDSLQVLHDSTVEAILRFSDTIKSTWPRPVLTGAFYGYYDGGFASASVGGHLAPELLCSSGKIDFLAAPFPYHPCIRGVEGVSIARGFLESMRLSHILWLTEMDCAPIGTSETVGGDPALLAENTAVMKRHVLEPFTRGHGMWFFDHRMFPSSIYLKKGWWNTPHFMKEIGKLRALCEKKALEKYEPQADVLLVWDARYYLYMTHINLPHYGVMYPFMEAIGKSGVCYDSIYLHDLQKAELSRYRAVVFMTAVCVSKSLRDFIDTHVKADRRTVIFMHASGLMDEQNTSVSLMEELTGMRCAFCESQDHMITELPFSVRECTVAERFEPAFSVQDSRAIPLAYYPDKVVAAAYREFEEYTSVVFGLPPIHADILRELFRKTGAHIYSDGGEALMIGSGMVVITLAKAGEYCLRLPGGLIINDSVKSAQTVVYDLKTGKKIG